MSKIRKSARGQECQVRFPGICNGNPETVVAAHIRVAGTCGVGMKPSDLATVRACSACHDVMDGRALASHITATEKYEYLLEALCRQLQDYEREGLVIAK